MKIRLALSKAGGALVDAARELEAPILISANALRYHKSNSFRFRFPALHGLDVALDSAGFVAMSTYGAYPWSRKEYLSLVRSHPWSWWAAMDYCVEEEVAPGRREILRRIDRTADSLSICLALSGRYPEVHPPVPVLQGRTVGDYLLSLRLQREILPIDPLLVGVGSVCRRPSWQIIQIVDALDKELDPDTRLHLFWVKGDSLGRLSRYGERVASVDSGAWGVSARYEPGPTTNDVKIRHMRSWWEKACRATSGSREDTLL